jgi:hypothetical protein
VIVAVLQNKTKWRVIGECGDAAMPMACGVIDHLLTKYGAVAVFSPESATCDCWFGAKPSQDEVFRLQAESRGW